MDLPWELDFEVALRVLRRRWWDEVSDLLEQSSGDALAFDELELDDDILELDKAVGSSKLARLALRSLGDAGPEPEGDPGLRALEALPERGRAFLRLVGANLAFALRTDELLSALARAPSGPAPRLAPEVVGGLLARARSARWAREALATLEAPLRERALGGVRPSSRAGDYRVLHARTTPEVLGEAIGRVVSRDGLVPVDWGVRKSREEDSAKERWLVSRPHNSWATAIARGGVGRDLALALSAKVPSLGRVAWAERSGETARFAVFEGGRLLDDDERLRARIPDLELDDVAGALRTLGIVAHDPASPAGALSLVFQDYVAEGRSSSPARLRRQGVVGFAFSPPTPKGEARPPQEKLPEGVTRKSGPKNSASRKSAPKKSAQQKTKRR